MTVPAEIRVYAADGAVLFKVKTRPEMDEFRPGYEETARGFAAMHDGIAEALAGKPSPKMPTLGELRGPDEWDCFYEDEEPGRARRLMNWMVHGRS